MLANDPDADRLGVAVPDPAATAGGAPLTGDEIGALLADHLLRTRPLRRRTTCSPPPSCRRACSSRWPPTAGVAYGEALTGFKWVVRTPAPGQRFAFGYEEALGYCVGDLVRDKDGITAALVARATLVGRAPAEGSSVVDRLDELARATART